jgi:hypothetical protein
MQKDFLGNIINKDDWVVKALRTSCISPISIQAKLELRKVGYVSEDGVKLYNKNSDMLGPFVRTDLLVVIKDFR